MNELSTQTNLTVNKRQKMADKNILYNSTGKTRLQLTLE